MTDDPIDPRKVRVKVGDITLDAFDAVDAMIDVQPRMTGREQLLAMLARCPGAVVSEERSDDGKVRVVVSRKDAEDGWEGEWWCYFTLVFDRDGQLVAVGASD
jgi:hypothetical protein